VNGIVEIKLADVFVDMTDTLVDGIRPDRLFARAYRAMCTGTGRVRVGPLTDGVVAASSERTWLLELFQLQADEGPCQEGFRAGGSPTAEFTILWSP
jgi:hypothetical protein